LSADSPKRTPGRVPKETSLTVGNEMMSVDLDLPLILNYKWIKVVALNFVDQQNACIPF